MVGCTGGQPGRPRHRTSHRITPLRTEQFKEHFEQYGPVAESQIMQDHNSGRSRGFG